MRPKTILAKETHRLTSLLVELDGEYPGRSAYSAYLPFIEGIETALQEVGDYWVLDPEVLDLNRLRLRLRFTAFLEMVNGVGLLKGYLRVDSSSDYRQVRIWPEKNHTLEESQRLLSHTLTTLFTGDNAVKELSLLRLLELTSLSPRQIDQNLQATGYEIAQDRSLSLAWIVAI